MALQSMHLNEGSLFTHIWRRLKGVPHKWTGSIEITQKEEIWQGLSEKEKGIIILSEK